MTADIGSLSSFVPVRLAALLDRVPDAPSHRSMRGAVLYADIAGSCELAEGLVARHGAEGVDRLSGVLNNCFEVLIDVVERAGGEIVQFAGDAMLVIWPATGTSLRDAVVAATRSALDLGSALAGSSALASHGVTVRTGVGAGDFGAARVGGASGRWEIVVSGPAVEDAFRASAVASAGSAVLAQTAFESAEGLVTGSELRDGLVRDVRVVGAAPQVVHESTATSPAYLDRLVPDVIRARMQGGLDAWLAELRHLSIMFVNVRGAGFGGDGDLARLDAATCAIKDALHDHNGYFRQLSVDDKGLVVVAAFGVPPVRRERQPGDAVRAAHRIARALTGMGLEASIGIASGRVFCGVIGSAVRREYAIVGNTVNLAARLMMVEHGAIVCDAVTTIDALNVADLEPMPPLTLKGFTEPVTPARLRGLKEVRAPTPRSTAALTGPEAEIRVCLDLVAALGENDVRAVVIEGAAGQGKSTLMSALAADAGRAGHAVLAGAAMWNEQSAPYHAWIHIVETVLGIDELHDARARTDRARAFLGSDPALARVAALINDIVPLGLDETPFTAGLDGLHRAEETRALITRLLTQFRGTRALLLIVDDAQWCDPVSWSVLTKGVPGVRRVLTVLSARPLDSVPDEARQVLEHPATLRRRLGPLGVAAIAKAGAAAAGVRALDGELAAWLDERSGGNPFFAQQIVFSFVQRGVLEVTDGQVARLRAHEDLSKVSVPASVEALVLSRIDAVEPVQQILLKAASVIGLRFSFGELNAVHPQPERRGRLRDDLDTLVRAQFLLGGGDAFAFAHQIVRDVAYGTMIGAQKKTTHEQFARYLEEAHASALTGEYSRLAHHWEAAGTDQPTFKYLELAGGEALRIGAFREGIVYFTKVLARDANRGRQAERMRRARWHRQLGDGYEGVGEMSDAERNMRDALIELGRPVPTSELGWTLTLLRGLARQLVHLVVPARTFPAGSSQREVQSELARASCTIGEVRLQENSAAGCAGAVFLSANACDHLGATSGVARPYSQVGVMFAMLKNRKLAQRYFRRARAIAQQVGDVSGEVRNDMAEAYVAYWRGEFGRADELLERNRELATAHGLGREHEMNEGTAAGLYLVQDRYAAHRERGLRLLETSRERSSALGQIWARLMLAGNCVRTGELDAAEQHVAEIRKFPNLLSQEQVACDGWDLAIKVRREDWWEARSLADRVATGLGIKRHGSTRARTIVVVSHWQPMSCYCEATLAFLDHTSPSERAVALRNAEHAGQASRRFAGNFAIAMPFALAHSGRLACMSGKAERGKRLIDRAAALAERLGMPYAHAQALQYRGESEAPQSEERRRYLEQARTEFTRLGCVWDARHAAQLARGLASEPGE